MKTTVIRHGIRRHGMEDKSVLCPDCNCDMERDELINFEYTTEHKYILYFQCLACLCEFKIETDNLKTFD